MCIGSEIGGIGACKGDDGGPGYIFDTGNGINEEKFVQVKINVFFRIQGFVLLFQRKALKVQKIYYVSKSKLLIKKEVVWKPILIRAL